MCLRRVGLALCLTLCACEGVSVAQPDGWDEAVRRSPVLDLDPDPRVVELELVARPAEISLVPAAPTPMWTYDGTVPGPHIEARVGDRLVVHFRNELPEPTTVHWHGVRVPIEMDGAPDHPNPPIPPGGTFEYDFVLPDEGFYWFHPHVRSAAQVAAGMYGTITVRAHDEPEMDELTLVLSDVAVDRATGLLRPPDSGGALGTLFGREGDIVLVNGRERPRIRVRNGVPLRMRFVAAAISRYFQLSVARHDFEVIGGDRGLYTRPHVVPRPVVLPGMRMDAVLTPRGRAGEVLELRWVPYDRGFGSHEFRDEVVMMELELVGDLVSAARPPLPARTFEPLDLTGATIVSIDLTRGEESGETVLGINGTPSWRAEPLVAHVGETQVWILRNTIEWAHPMHVHGFFFQPLDERLTPIGEWADTLDVPVDGTSRFAIRYDDRPGMWMFHCHILDHADAGMMGMIDVQPADGGGHTH